MRYIDISICREVIFPHIHHVLTKHEPAADYANENSGMEQLEKILSFIQNDDYYPTFAEKIAYLFCSVAGAQYSRMEISACQ